MIEYHTYRALRLNPRSVELEEDQLSDLKTSRKVVGELLPIVKDQKGRILNGRHRRAAGWKSTVVMVVTDDLDFLVKRLHFLVQRRASTAEQSEVVIGICAELEKRSVPLGKIASKVVQEISPWEPSYTYSLIPDRYKSAVGRPKAEFPTVGNSTGPCRSPRGSRLPLPSRVPWGQSPGPRHHL